MTVSTAMREPPESPASPYQDASELAGQPRAEIVYVLALVVAAAADFVAFNQVLSILLKELNSAEVIIAVVGVTACALALAHFAGQLYRDQSAEYVKHSRWLLATMVTAWAALGVAAFAVRLIVAAHTPVPFAGLATGITEKERLRSGAYLFLILYLASGLLAAVGAYRTHQPLRTRYRKASSDYQKARKQLGYSHALYERAVATLQVQVANRQREKLNHDAAQKLRQAVSAEMKAYARIQMAAHLQDPSATTGLTRPSRDEHRPGIAPTVSD